MVGFAVLNFVHSFTLNIMALIEKPYLREEKTLILSPLIRIKNRDAKKGTKGKITIALLFQK